MTKPAHKILIIDEDQIYRRSLFRTLSKEGYVISAAANLAEALEFLSQLKFDLILVDLFRPYYDGLEMMQSIFNAARDAKVIVVTPFGEKSLMSAVRAMGACDWLIKPAKRSAILNAASRALQQTVST